MSDVVTSQLPPTGDGEPVLEYVIRDLRLRAEAGLLKYKTMLRANNGRDALIDAYQEALDLVMYLRQRLIEEDKGGYGITRALAKTLVGPGWKALIDTAYNALEANCAYVTDVKEKFGLLRIYYRPGLSSDAEMLELEIDRLERFSANVCEICGLAGELRALPWIKTLCETHFQERKTI